LQTGFVMSTFHHLAILASLLATTAGLTPLTKIKATEVELAAFSKTAKGALDELFPTKPSPVLHIVGASDVESNVDWSDLCSRGATVVLVGPEAVIPRESSAGGSECVTVVKELYSVTKMARDGVTPDLLLLLNADLYTCVWRRSLVEFLKSGIPVVVTFYCEFEGAAITRLFNWPELEFTPQSLERCDETVKRAFGEASAQGHLTTAMSIEVKDIPEARLLWEFSPNPFAHANPKECYTLSEHGTRNAYWMAFTGAPDGANFGDMKDEL